MVGASGQAGAAAGRRAGAAEWGGMGRLAGRQEQWQAGRQEQLNG